MLRTAGTSSGRVVGSRIPLIDGVEKVTGKAKYTADLQSPDTLAGRIFRSPYSHAEILDLDVSEARALPGVVTVITGEDTPIAFGMLPISENEFPLARDKVRFKGDCVAAVAAITDEIAEQAIGLIKFKAKELPAYFTAEEAQAPNAVNIHEDRPGNLERDVHWELGDVTSGFEKADVVCADTFHCPEISHGQMEPNATVAEYDPLKDHMTVHSSTQVPYYVHRSLAQVLDMRKSQIRVVKPYIGGGFGARTATFNSELIAAVLARAAEGKVALKMKREETFITRGGRPDTKTKMRIAATKEGRLLACQCEAVQLGGAYGAYGIITILYNGAFLNSIYDIPAVKYDGFRIYTNTPSLVAQRGHGAVNVRYAFEIMLDQLAEELGIDPFEIRRRNLLRAPTETLNGVKIESYGLPDCIDWVEQATDYANRIDNLPAGKGLGIACSHYISGAPKPVHWTGEPHAIINLKMDFDSGITVLTGAAEIGQGSSTILAQSVAEVLGVEMKRIKVFANDSDITPKDNGSYSSRVTFMCGNAAIDAAQEMKAILNQAAAEKLEAEPDDIICEDEVFKVSGSQDPGLPFEEVVAHAMIDRGAFTCKGTFTAPREYQGTVKFRGSAVGPSMAHTYAACAAEVTVDEITGSVMVNKVWVAMDCGYAINPLSVEGQIEGAIWMGVGQALSEEAAFRNGLPLHSSFLDYRIPTIKDSPPIEIKIIESMDPNGPFGAKEASEGPSGSIAPAIANAVYKAVKKRINELPLTPERVFAAEDREEKRTAKFEWR